MAVTVQLTDYTPGIRNSTHFYQLLFSGNYGGGATGDTANFNAASNPNGLELEPGISANPPEGVPGIYSESLGGGHVQFVPNPATPGTFVLLAYQADGSEVSAGAYPASFTSAGAQMIVTLKKRSQ